MYIVGLWHGALVGCPLRQYSVFNLERRKIQLVNIRKHSPNSALVLAIAVLITGLSACGQIQQLLLSFNASDGRAPWRASHQCCSTADGSHSPFRNGLPMQRGFELAREEVNNSGTAR